MSTQKHVHDSRCFYYVAEGRWHCPAQPPEQETQQQEWATGPIMLSQGIECRDVLIKGVDRFTGGYICNATAEHAEQIVHDHNSHDALIATLESVRDDLRSISKESSAKTSRMKALEAYKRVTAALTTAKQGTEK